MTRKLSFTFMFNFTVDQLVTADSFAFIHLTTSELSGKLIISETDLGLHIYSSKGYYNATLPIERGLRDVAWSPNGNIVVSIRNNEHNYVMTMSERGNILKRTEMQLPLGLSVSNDNIIYLVDKGTHLYQSRDDGISWNLVFKSKNNKRLWCYVVKVTTVPTLKDDFWVIELEEKKILHLSVYNMNITSTGVYGEWLQTITIETDEKRIENIDYSCLFFDGSNIFVCDYFTRIIYLLSVVLRTPWQMISSSHIQNFVTGLAVNRKSQLLYVAQKGAIVSVFKLVYGE